MFTLYNSIVSVIVWLLLTPWQWLQMVLGRSTHEDWRQRRGICQFPPTQARHRLLCHAVSVGEVAALEPLVECLTESESGIEIVITVGNKDGKASAERLQKRYAGIIQVRLLPWDRYNVMVNWLERIRPDIVVVMETELWPSFFLACKNLDIPLYIANGRIYPADMSRYVFGRRFFQQVLCCVEWIGVQNERERRRFIRIAAAPADVHVVGNMKYDVPIPRHDTTDNRLIQLERAGMLIVAGSTHSPEERWILESFLQLRQIHPSVHLVLAPRHVARSGSIIRMAKKSGMKAVLWSTLENASADWDVLVLNEIGWLSTVYRHASVAVIGGSFVNRGGHNLLEAAAQECAIVIGPHVQHFQGMVEDFHNANAIVWLSSHHQLSTSLRELFAEPERRASLGNNGRILLDSRRGAARSYADVLQRKLNINIHDTSQTRIPVTTST